MSNVRPIDSTAAAMQTEIGASPPAKVNASQTELLSFSPLWLVLVAVIGLAFWFGRYSKADAPATATTTASAATAAVVRPSRVRNWLNRWFSPSTAVIETFTRPETQDVVNKLERHLPTAILNPASVKKSLSGLYTKLDGLRKVIDSTLQRFDPAAPDSANLEVAVNTATAKLISLKVTAQTAAAQRDAAIAERDRHIDSANHYKAQYEALRDANNTLSLDNEKLATRLAAANTRIATLTKKMDPIENASAAKADTLDKTSDKLFSLLEKAVGSNRGGNRPPQQTAQTAAAAT